MELTTKYDFIERTQKILRQYEKLVLRDSEKYEVVLLLNLALGLLIYLYERKRTYVPKDGVEKFDKIVETIRICKNSKMKDESKSVCNVCKHLRNSIPHCHFEFKKNEGTKLIDAIKFKSYRNASIREENLVFEASINVNILKSFLIDISSKTIKNYKNLN